MGVFSPTDASLARSLARSVGRTPFASVGTSVVVVVAAAAATAVRTCVAYFFLASTCFARGRKERKIKRTPRLDRFSHCRLGRLGQAGLVVNDQLRTLSYIVIILARPDVAY